MRCAVSRRRNELRSAARDDLWLCRPLVAVAARLWRSVVARLRPNPDGVAGPRSLPSSPRERRRTPRSEAPSTDKRALASSRPPRRCCHRHDDPGGPSTESHEGIRARSRTHAQPQPCVCTSIGRPSAGICKQPEARARPAKRPNLARAGTFSAPARCPKKGCEPRNTRGNRAGAPKAPVSRAGERPVSSCTRHGGQLAPAERSRVATRPTPTLGARRRMPIGQGPTRVVARECDDLQRTVNAPATESRCSDATSIMEPMTRHRNRIHARRLFVRESHAALTHRGASRAQHSATLVVCTTNDTVPRRLGNLYERNVCKQMC
jgi:hypothetical protein